MKAPKISLDAARLQQMLLLHVEKIVLGVVILAVLWFVYQGATLTALDPNKSPDKLASTSVTVTSQINDPSHEGILVPKRDPKHPVTSLVTQGQVANSHLHYPLDRGWKTPDYPKATQRVDPRHFPPGKPVVHAFYGPMAFIPGMNDVDPILAIDAGLPAEAEATPRQPTVRPPQPGRQPPRGEGGRLPPGPGGRRQPGGAGMLEGNIGQLPPGYGEMGPGRGMPGMTGAPGDRSLPPEAIVGFRLGGADLIAKEGKAVVVLASVPFEKQFEEYAKAFKDALDYDEYRDIPRYATFQVERADVTDNPEIDPAQATWTALAVLKAANEAALWGPSPNEIVDLNAIDPILTHRVPPFLQRELYDAMVHPDIPKSTFVGDGQGGFEGQLNPANGPAKEPGKEDDILSAPTAGAAGGPGGEGSIRQPSGYPRGSMMMEGGYPRRGGGFPNMRPPGGYGEGAMAGPGSSPSEVKLAKYKLLRFTDTTVEPLRKYRYRIKLVMEDPNNPYVGATILRWDPSRTTPLKKPSTQSMSANVITRIQKAESTKYPFLLESEPSEPSDIVELPPANRYFAGKATPGGGSALKPGTPIIYTSQPSATILTVEWDKKLAVDVPAEKDVFRGSTLNFDKEVDVIHPSQLIIHPIGKYPFRNNSLVLDFAGGNEIPTVDNRRSDAKVPEPCEILIIDGLGNLQLLTETDDVEGFRRYLPPKKEEPKPAGPAGFGPEMEAPGGILDGPRPGPRTRPRGGGSPG